jgi:iron complex transport system ATP-binding protein
MILKMDNISWTPDGKNILRNINWTIMPGEHWAIIGLNGSGKTSLLNMINGYISPSSGGMTVLGKSFGSYDWRNLRKKIGFISSSMQDRFYKDETVEEIVLSGMFATIGLYDKPQRKDRDKARALLRQLHCDYAAHQMYMELSQGEKQKVLIARALIHSPQLLIMDEPCAGLDILSRERVLSSVENLALRTTAPSLLYVSHHIEEILPVFSHTLLLRRGEIHSAGRTRRVLTTANLSSFFETGVKVRWRKDRAWIQI